MKITIIPSDGVVGVDGVFRKVDLSKYRSTVHAVQFDTQKNIGHVESFGEGRAPDEIEIDDISPYQDAIDAWTAAASPPPDPPGPPELSLNDVIDVLKASSPTLSTALAAKLTSKS